MNIQIVQLNVIIDYVVDIIVRFQRKLVDRPKSYIYIYIEEFNKELFFFKCNYETEAIYINHILKVKKTEKREICSSLSLLKFAHAIRKPTVKFVVLYFSTHMYITLNLIVATYRMKSSSICRVIKKKTRRNEIKCKTYQLWFHYRFWLCWRWFV